MSDTPKPRAWMRRWAYEGKECPPKVKNEKGRWVWPKEAKFHAITPFQVSKNDVPLFALEESEIK
jgi:hypothetical protein